MLAVDLLELLGRVLGVLLAVQQEQAFVVELVGRLVRNTHRPCRTGCMRRAWRRRATAPPRRERCRAPTSAPKSIVRSSRQPMDSMKTPVPQMRAVRHDARRQHRERPSYSRLDQKNRRTFRPQCGNRARPLMVGQGRIGRSGKIRAVGRRTSPSPVGMAARAAAAAASSTSVQALGIGHQRATAPRG